MTSTPYFDTEFAAQCGLARRQLDEAVSVGDDSLAQAAAGRLAELAELLSLHAAPVLLADARPATA